jgi:GR25 family glycosyltransferase involved in LPS biosynthesis
MPDFVNFKATIGEAALFLGHRQVWQEVIDTNAKGAVVLEDDVVITDSSPISQWQDVFNDLDIVFLNNRVFPDYGSLPEFDITSDGSHLVPVAGGYGTDGYLVTHTGAKKLIELFQVAVAPAEIQMMGHLADCDIDVKSWSLARSARKSDIRLRCRRLFPFIVDHPPVNYSTTIDRYLRGFAPGLWLNDVR